MEVAQDLNRPGQIRLSLNAVSAPRLDRLRARQPDLEAWPLFKRLFGIRHSKDTVIQIALAEFDSMVAMLQLLHAQPQLNEDRFDGILDGVIRKLEDKGGPNCDAGQVQDFAYEGQIALLLDRFMGDMLRFEINDRCRPDHVFTVHFHEWEHPSKIAIDCKNIHNQPSDIRDLVRTVSGKIVEAMTKHEPRAAEFDDLLVFIDLPPEMLSRPKRDYYSLIVNAWRQLDLEGCRIEESHVVFTATSQSNVAEFLRLGPASMDLCILRPHVVNKTEVPVSPAHLVFLSLLYRKVDGRVNMSNWSDYAVNILDPEQYWL